MSVQDFPASRDVHRTRHRGPRQQAVELLHWNALSRPAKKALARLLGGGSLRGVAPEAVAELSQLGLIDGHDHFAQLTPAGWHTLKTSRDWLRGI